MTIQRMENVGIVVDDLDAVTTFFVELGLELEGKAAVKEPWAARISGFDNVLLDVAMLRTPDGQGRLELMKFHTPPAVRAEPENAPANTLGIRRILFAVEDIDGIVASLRVRGFQLVGELTQVDGGYLFCYVRGPEGIIVGLAEHTG